MRGARGSSVARRAGLVVCNDSASAGLTSPSGRRSNTRGSPTVENTRFLCPTLPSVPSSSIASSTLSRLCAGSPIPMKTTLLTALIERASATCATISPLVTWRIRPLRPVMQNWQPTAQPTWLETHTPPRGSSTLSTVWPSPRPSSSRAAPPSVGWDEISRTRLARSASISGNASRSLLGRKSLGRRRP